MQKISVAKDELLSKLENNREKHRGIFETAIEKYREEAIKAFQNNIDTIKKGGPVREYLNLPVPEDHTDDYDTAIQMCEWHVGDTVGLTDREFKQYVQDQWGWNQSFMATTASYTSPDSMPRAYA